MLVASFINLQNVIDEVWQFCLMGQVPHLLPSYQSIYNRAY